MNQTNQKKIIFMNLSGAYDNAPVFHQLSSYVCLDLKGTEGTNCYCDDHAKEEIRNAISGMEAEAIHYIDIGNYHYLSLFWIEKIKVPFTLAVFDNHTDMQLPAFPLLSCGGWIASALEECPLLKKLILIGPPEAAYRELCLQNPDLPDDPRICYISGEQIQKGEYASLIDGSAINGCLYLSIDEDILSTGEVTTGWSQGNLSKKQLASMVQYLTQNYEVLGTDLCCGSGLSHIELFGEIS